jgi:phospholipase D-like protein/putative oligomerization/nucleic acid binding protein
MPIVLAADYPFLDVLWSMLIFFAFFLWIWLAVTCFVDIFRRHDMGGFVKALWVIVIIITPYFGVLLYLIFYHRGIAERSARGEQQAQQAFDDRVREAAGTQGPAAEIEKARRLRESGAINEEEFERLKAKALAG